jgi:hypothetical protein
MPIREAQDKLAPQLRERAKELRALADGLADETVKNRLLKVTSEYEQLALIAEAPVVVPLPKHRRA